MSYFILTAMAECGEYRLALDSMKEFYGGMLKMGATTFWEDFDLEWTKNAARIDEFPKEGEVDIHGDFGKFCYKGFRHSFCHGWSAGVIAYLMETVAGIKVRAKNDISVQLHLNGLKWVKVSYPTCKGLMVVEHTLQANGTVRTKFNRDVKG